MVHPLDPDPRTAGLAVLLNAIHAGPQIDLTGIPHRQISSHIKEIEASVDDAWYPAEVRSWSPSRSGWWANCSRYRGIGETELGTFHEDDVRPDTVDRSYGRES